VTLLIAVVVAVLAVYAVSMAVLWRFQERVVFQPPRTVAEPVEARKVEYTASDGTALFAYLVGDCVRPSRVLLAFHGNADLAAWFLPWAARAARETATCVMIAEYRGYAGLQGPPSYEGVSRDARAALAYLRQRFQLSSDRIIYYGHSLGSAVAAELAAEAPPQALVLQSPFTSARSMAKRLLMPGLIGFWRAVSRVHYDTRRHVAELTVPVSVAHGDRDLVIPLRMGREVFDAAHRPAELLVVHGAGHNDVAEVGGAAYWDWLRRACASRVEATVTR
jgi:pimeloyl-ACP methyl ester carboxylesterase